MQRKIKRKHRPSKRKAWNDGLDAERVVVALKKIGFTKEEMAQMDMSEAYDFIDAANPPDEDEIWREATAAEEAAFWS